ncbi:MAG TPA: (2Fe-2S)-binding protein [Methylocella sp.]|nr:(2Fe-2S)-binding protein [Methylocella sp.]
MIVCSCNVISDENVRNALSSGRCSRTPGAVYKCLGCSPSCGRCIATVKAIINEAVPEEAPERCSSSARFERAAEALCPA